jgi:hypothetical protein
MAETAMLLAAVFGGKIMVRIMVGGSADVEWASRERRCEEQKHWRTGQHVKIGNGAYEERTVIGTTARLHRNH